MRTQTTLLLLLASLTASGCQQVECAKGTIERDGQCVPADFKGEPVTCGPFTELVGEHCVPMFPPTVCEDGSTEPEIDDATGVTTCKGTGVVAGCGTPIACATPTGATKQTICGQLYDFETGEPFAAPGASGTPCNPAMPTATGPCSLTIQAYDAATFAMAPTSTNPLSVGSLTIDDCGRYKVQDIEVGSVSLYVGLGVDDPANQGPAGVTITAAVATPKLAKTAVKDFEAFIVKPSTAASWSTTAGVNLLQTGVYAPVFRAHKVGSTMDRFANQSGVTMTKGGTNTGVTDYYFMNTETTRTTVDPNAMATGVNGTALITNAAVSQSVTWSGTGGTGPGCIWETKAAASIPGIVFISVFHKTNDFGATCND